MSVSFVFFKPDCRSLFQIKRPDEANMSARQPSAQKSARGGKGKKEADQPEIPKIVWPSPRVFHTLTYIPPSEQAQETTETHKKDTKGDKKAGKGGGAASEDYVQEPEDAVSKDRVLLLGGQSTQNLEFEDMSTAWIFHVDEERWYNPPIKVNENAVDYFLQVETEAIEQQKRATVQFCEDDADLEQEDAPSREQLMHGPPPRAGHSATLHKSSKSIVIVGGRATNGKMLGDIWILDVDNLEWLPVPRSFSSVSLSDSLKAAYKKCRQSLKEDQEEEDGGQDKIQKEIDEIIENLQEIEAKIPAQAPSCRSWHSAQTAVIEKDYCYDPTRCIIPRNIQQAMKNFVITTATENTQPTSDIKGKGKDKQAKGKPKGKPAAGKAADKSGGGQKAKGSGEVSWPLAENESDEVILIHGGMGSFNDPKVWALDIAKCRWFWIKADDTSTLSINCRCCHHTFVFDKGDQDKDVKTEADDDSQLQKTKTVLHMLGGYSMVSPNAHYYIRCEITKSSSMHPDDAEHSHPVFEEKDIPGEGYGQVNYRDGSVYVGNFRHSQRWDYGEITFANGHTFKGYWEEDLPHGTGTATTPEWTYEGEWKYGKISGKGVIKYHGTAYSHSPLGGDHFTNRSREDRPASPAGSSVSFGDFRRQSLRRENLSRRSSRTCPSSPSLERKSGRSESREGFTPGQYIVYQPGSARALPDESNPKKYDGEWVEDMRSGYGMCQYDNGYVYEGNWSNDLWHGYGRLSYDESSYYEGYFCQGRKSGKGTEVLKDKGEKYSGEYFDNRRHGNGYLEVADGTTYEGEFRYGKKAGTGRETTPTLDIYAGKFQQNVFHGRGKMEYRSGAIYDGTWMNGKPHGEGWMKGYDGSEYTGSFEFGVKSGIGVCNYSDDCYYEGEWANDRREGHGTCRINLRHGSYTEYQGQWQDGLMHGKGLIRSPFLDDIFSVWEALQVTMDKFRNPTNKRTRPSSRHSIVHDASPREENISLFEGTFRCGYASGNGELRCASGDRYDGQWENNRPNGRGELHLSVKNAPRLHHILDYEGGFTDFYPNGKGKALYL